MHDDQARTGGRHAPGDRGRQVTVPGDLPGDEGAVAELLAAGHEAGTVRPGLDPEIILLALCGIWQLDPDSQEQADALIDLLVTGLSAATTGSASP
ncbi:SbtR family transcriptional regulator [Thermocatellispora tengchongensis]|uniref:SbtR family transcriptional regulator n=1 Tax=Thermocatellispora tengchongensis TaxID=1073253 RepID=UPI00362AFFD8